MGRVLAVVGVAFLALASPASAELVGEFDARLTDVQRSYGAYTVIADARVYETSGRPPPPLTHATAHFAAGTIVLDARPHIPDPFSADLHLLLAAGEGGALASVLALVVPNEFTPAYAYQVLEGRLVESRAGGRFGYRLELPTRVEPLIPGLTLHLAELHLEIRGLRMKRRRGGRLFWTKVPSCPRSRKLSFGADYSFEGSAAISKRRKVDCRRFARRPSVHREGQISR
jgi:hypothetical protein